MKSLINLTIPELKPETKSAQQIQIENKTLKHTKNTKPK